MSKSVFTFALSLCRHFGRTMDELVHDLVSALEESSEQARGGGCSASLDLALPAGRMLKRHARKRRGRKRRSENSTRAAPCHAPCHTSHASDSSLDEHRDTRLSSSSNANANNSDSDEQLGAKRGKRPPWHEDPGITDANRSLRRRRKVKRMAIDPPPEFSPKSTAGSREDGKGNDVATKGRVKKRKLALAHRLVLDAADEGVVVESEEAGLSGKEKMDFEEHKGSDEDMSDRWLVFSLSCFPSFHPSPILLCMMVVYDITVGSICKLLEDDVTTRNLQ